MLSSYPWYIADWRNSETRLSLTLLQRGLYRELLDYCYLEGSLPDDRKRLLQIAGVTYESEADLDQITTDSQASHALKSARTRLGHSLNRVLSLFTHDPITGRYHHAKVDEVMTKLVSYHEQKRHAGAKSGQARRERALNVRSEQKRTEAEPPPTPTPTPSPAPSMKDNTPLPPLQGGESDTIPLELVPPPSAPVRRQTGGHRTTDQIRKALGERLAWWEAFWKVYPCHEGMNPGMDAYERKICTRELATKAYRGAERYAARARADPTLKLKYAQGWINDERWTDEPEPERPARKVEYFDPRSITG